MAIKKNLTYTTIIHSIRKELGLSLLEYCVADTIYHLSNNPNSKIKGWCYAPKQTIADNLGTTRQTVHEVIASLIEKEIVEKDEDTKYLKTTEKWYKNVVLVKMGAEYEAETGCKKTSQGVKKPDTTCKETLHQGVKKPDTYNYTNNDNNRYNCEQSSRVGKSKSNSNKDDTSPLSENTVLDEEGYLNYLRKMESNKSKHMRVIAVYLKKLYHNYGRQTFSTKAEKDEVIGRHCKAAKSVSKFTKEKIGRAMDLAFEKVGQETTLETVYKYLTK